MADNELMFKSALEQARLVRDGDVTAREMVEASLGAIERVNEELSAFVTLCDERALDEADDVHAGDERPLAGVPIAIKDLTALTGGVRTTAGSGAPQHWGPPGGAARSGRLGPPPRQRARRAPPLGRRHRRRQDQRAGARHPAGHRAR